MHFAMGMNLTTKKNGDLKGVRADYGQSAICQLRAPRCRGTEKPHLALQVGRLDQHVKPLAAITAARVTPTSAAHTVLL